MNNKKQRELLPLEEILDPWNEPLERDACDIAQELCDEAEEIKNSKENRDKRKHLVTTALELLKQAAPMRPGEYDPNASMKAHLYLYLSKEIEIPIEERKRCLTRAFNGFVSELESEPDFDPTDTKEHVIETGEMVLRKESHKYRAVLELRRMLRHNLSELQYLDQRTPTFCPLPTDRVYEKLGETARRLWRIIDTLNNLTHESRYTAYNLIEHLEEFKLKSMFTGRVSALFDKESYKHDNTIGFTRDMTQLAREAFCQAHLLGTPTLESRLLDARCAVTLGRVYEDQDIELEARKHFEEAIETLESADFSKDPKLQAQAQFVKAFAQAQLGRYLQDKEQIAANLKAIHELHTYIHMPDVPAIKQSEANVHLGWTLYHLAESLGQANLKRKEWKKLEQELGVRVKTIEGRVPKRDLRRQFLWIAADRISHAIAPRDENDGYRQPDAYSKLAEVHYACARTEQEHLERMSKETPELSDSEPALKENEARILRGNIRYHLEKSFTSLTRALEKDHDLAPAIETRINLASDFHPATLSSAGIKLPDQETLWKSYFRDILLNPANTIDLGPSRNRAVMPKGRAKNTVAKRMPHEEPAVIENAKKDGLVTPDIRNFTLERELFPACKSTACHAGMRYHGPSLIDHIESVRSAIRKEEEKSITGEREEQQRARATITKHQKRIKTYYLETIDQLIPTDMWVYLKRDKELLGSKGTKARIEWVDTQEKYTQRIRTTIQSLPREELDYDKPTLDALIDSFDKHISPELEKIPSWGYKDFGPANVTIERRVGNITPIDWEKLKYTSIASDLFVLLRYAVPDIYRADRDTFLTETEIQEYLRYFVHQFNDHVTERKASLEHRIKEEERGAEIPESNKPIAEVREELARLGALPRLTYEDMRRYDLYTTLFKSLNLIGHEFHRLKVRIAHLHTEDRRAYHRAKSVRAIPYYLNLIKSKVTEALSEGNPYQLTPEQIAGLNAFNERIQPLDLKRPLPCTDLEDAA